MDAGRTKLLHVEDNPGDVRLMREFLQDSSIAGFDLAAATSLGEALACLTRERYDAVLLDLSLPDGQGIETVRRIGEAAPDVPIVVLTGLDDETLAIDAVKEGAQDYLVKGRLDPQLSPRAIRYAIERHRSRQELRSQSLTDELTGLYNRRGFLVLAEQQIRLAVREHRDLILVFCDVDNLKEINDTFGHSEGDDALRTAGRILRTNLRQSDLVARLGGDEFTILALDTSGMGAASMLERLRSAFEAYNGTTDRPYPLSVSMGAARRERLRPRPMSELLAEADRILYEQKRMKRGMRLDWPPPMAAEQLGTG